ncbi:hypothetical protein D918_02329 [Trichuris suis]|nr:hypothetical protein D918_02329 [Trichuris suis]
MSCERKYDFPIVSKASERENNEGSSVLPLSLTNTGVREVIACAARVRTLLKAVELAVLLFLQKEPIYARKGQCFAVEREFSVAYRSIQIPSFSETPYNGSWGNA